MPQFIYRDLNDTPTDITPYVKLVDGSNPSDMAENAEERSVGTWELEIEDNGALDLQAQRTFYVLEYDASDPVVWVGQTGDKHSSREMWRVTTGRVYRLQLDDLNTILERRVIRNGDGGNRPAESDVARMQWLEGTGYIGGPSSYLSTASPTDMDAVDYTGRMASEVIEDCMGQSGKNAFMFRDPANTRFSTFYGDSAATNSVLTSTLRISNVLSDVDSSLTWAASHDSVLEEGASRVYSGVFANYDGGTVYRENLSTVNNFSHRDVVLSWPDVKSSTKANTRAQRYLDTINDEEDIITTSIVVDRSHVNDAHAGYRIQAKFSHFPGYTNFNWMRILNRAVTVASPDKYLIKYTLSATPGASAAGVVQFKFGTGTGVEFDNPVTLGHTIVAFVFNRDSGTTPPDHVIDGVSNPAVTFTTIAEVVKAFSPSHFARWGGMYYRVVTSVDAGQRTYTSTGSSQSIGLLEIVGTYASIFGAQNTTDNGATVNCGGSVTPPHGSSLVVGMAAIGHSDNPGTIPGPVTSDAGITELEDVWGGGSPYIYIAYLPVTGATGGSYSVGGALTGSMLDLSWVFCGVTAVFT